MLTSPSPATLISNNGAPMERLSRMAGNGLHDDRRFTWQTIPQNMHVHTHTNLTSLKRNSNSERSSIKAPPTRKTSVETQRCRTTEDNKTGQNAPFFKQNRAPLLVASSSHAHVQGTQCAPPAHQDAGPCALVTCGLQGCCGPASWQRRRSDLQR